MNSFCRGSALSFTSGLPGGQAEHARRWNLVRDPQAGVCLIFVTPEKIDKSNKLKTELQKLHDAGRLGRFVIDECHCATQWGHDFRPDYTKLGTLKSMFPDVPLMAVTATASDRVRDDCARILRIGTNYRLFRSTFNRPNLVYSVRVKAEGGRKVVEDMAAFIKKEHYDQPGIVYTLSKRDADDVAGMLCDCGIVAKSYHSEVSNSEKERVHRSWMRNETQVVVATIAFGLGINKPDVRFVLHHCLSKSAEAYYQESGRAGRDGKPANCVLYYSPRDVPRVLCLIHGMHSEGTFWSMVRYAQASGDDRLCRALILSILGEPGARNVSDILKAGCEGTEQRDVGRHGQVVARMVVDAAGSAASSGRRRRAKDDLTLSKLLLAWRSKDPAADYIRDYPPAPELTRDECERIVLCLMVENVLLPKVVTNKYSSSMYIQPGPKAYGLAHSDNPHVTMSFPLKKAKAAASSSSTSASEKRVSTGKKATSKAKKSDSSSGGWISTKRRDPILQEGRKKSSAQKSRGRPRSSGSASAPPSSPRGAHRARRGGPSGGGGGGRTGASSARATASSPGSEVIELDMSSSSDGEYESPSISGGRGRKRTTPRRAAAKGGAAKRMRQQIEYHRDFFEDSSDADEL